ncbi:hypothetical protein [Gallibacterium genomosp. 1]|uniref:hypothetical protein n=1 Tax=Gallibacterium genomosp. 1 TaxID=155515 RepID=UPI001427D08C|nr:hypothetical protein [Gallibacterium genomosp. 1]
MINKYLVRVYGVIEIAVEAESIEQAAECDLSCLDLNAMPHHITEIAEIVEIEEL